MMPSDACSRRSRMLRPSVRPYDQTSVRLVDAFCKEEHAVQRDNEDAACDGCVADYFKAKRDEP